VLHDVALAENPGHRQSEDLGGLDESAGLGRSIRRRVARLGNSGRRHIDKRTALGAAQGAMLWCLAMVMESHQAA
jgi:hypothetical protein